jgi:hypothetical protein
MDEFYVTDAEPQLKLAAELLKKVREVAAGQAIVFGMSIYHIDRAVSAIRNRVKYCNANLEDVGVTDAELEQLLKDAPTNVARKAIERIRAGVYNYDDDHIIAYCVSVGAKLQDLKTDEAEIASLKTKYHKLHGTNMVEKIRSGRRLLHRQPSPVAGVNYLRKWVAEHKLLLVDIGTSEVELDALAV